MCRTGRDKTLQVCVKEQFPEAPLVLPTHNELLSFPREALGERVQTRREEHRPCRRDLLSTLELGTHTVLRNLHYVLLSWFPHMLPTMLLSILLCQGVCIALKPFMNHVCAVQVLCFEEPRDLTRPFPVSGILQLFIGREAVRYEMNEFHKQLFLNVFFQLFFPWDFPPFCACFPHLICCERIDFQRKKSHFERLFWNHNWLQGDNLIGGDETGTLEIRS